MNEEEPYNGLSHAEEWYQNIQKAAKKEKDKHNEEVKEKAKEGDHITKTCFGYLFNLDDEETYKSQKYKDFDCKELNKFMEEEIGGALSYMLCYMPGRHDINSWVDGKSNGQYNRVVQLGKEYYKTYYDKYSFKEPSEEQRLWARKQIWLFQEETENMC
jgi:hypothetical protein